MSVSTPRKRERSSPSTATSFKKRKLFESNSVISSDAENDAEDENDMDNLENEDDINLISSSEDEDEEEEDEEEEEKEDKDSFQLENKRRKKYTKRDLRSCFTSFIKQMHNITHPSNVTIDIDSEMKLQRQRRLIELDLISSSSDDVDSDTNLFDNYFSLNQSDDDDNDDILIADTFNKSKFNNMIPFDNINSITTGSEQVDNIIDQFKNYTDNDLLNLSFTSSNLEQHEPTVSNIIKIQLSTEDSTQNAELNNNLISPTSSFNKLLNENNRNQKLVFQNATPININISANSNVNTSSPIQLNDFLNLESTHEEQLSQLSDDTPFKKFEYRHNHGGINFALTPQQPKRRKTKALNRRALYFGNSSEMVNNDMIPLNEFLI